MVEFGPLRAGRHDTAERRQSIRKGREKGCSVYIPAEDLIAAGFDPADPPPFYRTFARHKRSVIVNLYREQ